MQSFTCKRCGSYTCVDVVWLYVVKIDKRGYDVYHIKCKHCEQLHELKLEYVANEIKG